MCLVRRGTTSKVLGETKFERPNQGGMLGLNLKLFPERTPFPLERGMDLGGDGNTKRKWTSGPQNF